MPTSPRRSRLTLLAVLLIAASLRILPLRADLWLDELWSVGIAQNATTLADIWQDPGNWVDNNHPLLTVWLMAVGRVETPGAWWLYRLPPLLAGLATIAAGHRLATQFSRPRQVLTAPLTAALAHRTSHIAQRPFLPPLLTSLWFTLALPFVVYSTEARGYALALAAMVGCLTFLSSADVCVNRGVSPARGPEGEAPKSFPPSLLKLVTYWLLCAIGLTAHFSFIHALVGFLFLVRPLKRNLAYHAVPFALAAVVYLTFIRHLKVAGGPPLDTLSALAGMASMLAGGPWLGALAWITAACVAPPFLLLAWSKRREPFVQGAVAACFIALLSVFAKGLALGRPEVVYPRYFLLAATWAGLVLTLDVARQLEEGWARKRPLQWIPFAFITAIVLGFATLDTAQFLLRGGRGQYLAPLQIVAASSEPSLASDYDTRTQRVLGFYQRFLPAKVFYLPATDATLAPRWYLANTATLPHGASPAPILFVRNATYHLRRTSPNFGPSGWSWQLYERE